MSNELVKNNDKTLSREQMQYVVSAIVDTFDVEFRRLVIKEHQHVITDTLIPFYQTTNIFTFFTDQQVLHTSRLVTENSVVRSFVLNITDRVSFIISCNDVVKEDSLIDHLATSVLRNHNSNNGKYALLNSELVDSISISPDSITTVLKDNFWLVIVYILLLYMNETNLYKEIFNTNNK